MHKPGHDFAFRPNNNLTFSATPSWSGDDERGYKGKRTVRAQLDDFFGLVTPPSRASRKPETSGNRNQPKPSMETNGRNGANGSGPSHNTPGFAPINAIASYASGGNANSRPAVKASAYSGKSSLEDKYANLFIQPRNRPEHHRPQRIKGPLQPTFKDRKPAAAPMFDSKPGPIGSASNPISVVDHPPAAAGYSQPGVFSEYVDPKQAASNIKALLEGSIEDEEEEIVKEDEKEDKSHVEGLNVRLLPHQVEGVEWMKNRELGPVKKGKVPKGGLLADDMGLGKTLQSLALILSNAKPKDKHPGVEKTTLVVAPLALIRQWEAEIKEKVADTHRLKVLVHHGPQRSKDYEDLRRYDVVITTYQILVSEHGNHTATAKTPCFGLHWYRVILDEAHTIKNRNAKATKACYELRSIYRWCLSGTPMQNNLDELQSLVKFLRIQPYDDLKEWREHFDLPMKKGKGHVAFTRLHSLLNCFMKRRTKDILKQEGALKTGGSPKKGEEGKSSTSDFKVTERKVVSIAAEFTPAELRFYKRLEERTDKSLDVMKRGKINYASALVLLLRLRQACNHPKLVEGKLEKDRDALSEETRPKKSGADVDALADLFGGLDVEAKYCEICGWELDAEHRQPGSDKCKACFEDLEYFKHHEEGGELKAPKTRTRTKKKSKVQVRNVKVEKVKKVKPKPEPKRKPRNRRAILDSDDEEEEGEWLVSGDEQESLHLGKAGGTDDENAEGGGESINSEDSEEEETQDGSQLSSFIVDDGEDTKPEDLKRAIEESDSEDSLESLSAAIESQLTTDNNPIREVSPSTADEESQLPTYNNPIREVSPSTADEEFESADEEYESADADSEAGTATESEEEEDDTGISESELRDSDSDSDDVDSYRSRGESTHVLASAKIRQLTTILHNECATHKFIVFSQFTSMLDLVEPFLRKEGIRYTRYDGSMRNDAREAALHSLRHDARTRVLLCSLRCGALGLNLTAASRVVILEPFWNPFVEEQAIDRVHRLTQTVDVVVYKLTIAGSVEERILELQEKKRLLAATALEGGANGKKNALKLGLNEMLDLFNHVGKSAASLIRDDDGGEFGDARGVRDDTMSMLTSRIGSKASRGRGQESAIYGRRW
ncbi:SNF2 family N-terminal domain-containing protein [Xylariomycetidae sp. FL0641]|nr:SNF2 family N-terminal domain-containing protein [Xylariomycetidae sp. FL0641]